MKLWQKLKDRIVIEPARQMQRVLPLTATTDQYQYFSCPNAQFVTVQVTPIGTSGGAVDIGFGVGLNGASGVNYPPNDETLASSNLTRPQICDEIRFKNHTPGAPANIVIQAQAAGDIPLGVQLGASVTPSYLTYNANGTVTASFSGVIVGTGGIQMTQWPVAASPFSQPPNQYALRFVDAANQPVGWLYSSDDRSNPNGNFNSIVLFSKPPTDVFGIRAQAAIAASGDLQSSIIAIGGTTGDVANVSLIRNSIKGVGVNFNRYTIDGNNDTSYSDKQHEFGPLTFTAALGNQELGAGGLRRTLDLTYPGTCRLQVGQISGLAGGFTAQAQSSIDNGTTWLTMGPAVTIPNAAAQTIASSFGNINTGIPFAHLGVLLRIQINASAAGSIQLGTCIIEFR